MDETGLVNPPQQARPESLMELKRSIDYLGSNTFHLNRNRFEVPTPPLCLCDLSG